MLLSVNFASRVAQCKEDATSFSFELKVWLAQ